MAQNKKQKQLPPILVDPELYDLVNQTAKNENRTRSNLLRTALQFYCTRNVINEKK